MSKCPFSRGVNPVSASAVDHSDDVTKAVNQAVLGELGRRGLLQFAAVGVGALFLSNLTGCATEEDEAGGGADAVSIGGVDIKGVSFYDDIETVTKATPLTTTPAADLAKFQAEAGARGKAIAGVIGFWLQKPYTVKDAKGAKVRGLFEELFDSRTKSPVFNPGIGPSIVFQHDHVIDVLKQTDAFTVDPYAPVMATSTSGSFYPAPAGKVPAGTPDDTSKGFYAHYMLGTDDDGLYVPDSLISRYCMKPSDQGFLRQMIRDLCEKLLADVKPGQSFDIVKAICRYAPVGVVQSYVGLPSFATRGAKGEGPFDIDGAKAGETFAFDADLAKRFKFQAITNGVVPTQEDLYNWIKDSFRNTFNNVQKDPAIAAAGLKATELLLAWSSRVNGVYKARLKANGYVIDGTTVPDTMIARLLVLQNDARTPAKVSGLMAAFACSTEEELLARTGDDRVQSNSFGVFVGAIANPEEANARIIQSLLNFKEGTLTARSGGGSYDDLKRLAKGANSGESNMKEIGAYMLEFLRLNPQGETLLRKCIKDATVGGVTIKAGTLVFNCHGAAMQDAAKIPQPAMVDIRRNPEATPYSQGLDGRKGEEPQSRIYLHHGYGRHKCLGRYASAITLQEVLRATLRKGDPVRVDRGDLKMDDKNLYADSFMIKLA